MGRRLFFNSLQDLKWWVERQLVELLLHKTLTLDNLALSTIHLAVSCKSLSEFRAKLGKNLNFPPDKRTAVFAGLTFDIVNQNRRVASLANPRLSVGLCFNCGLSGHFASQCRGGKWRDRDYEGGEYEHEAGGRSRERDAEHDRDQGGRDRAISKPIPESSPLESFDDEGEDKNLATSLQDMFSESMSVVTLIPAIKGGREKHGKSVEKLRVSWAEDVYDPPPSIVSHTRSKKQQPQKSESKDNRKKKGQKGSSNSRGSKDKKQSTSSPATAEVETPQVHLITMHTRDMKAAYKQADGQKIDRPREEHHRDRDQGGRDRDRERDSRRARDRTRDRGDRDRHDRDRGRDRTSRDHDRERSRKRDRDYEGGEYQHEAGGRSRERDAEHDRDRRGEPEETLGYYEDDLGDTDRYSL